MTGKPLFTHSRFEKVVYTFIAILVVLKLTASYVDQRRGGSALLDAVPAPEFSWRDFESDPNIFSKLKGKVVILHFWASWCGPCRTEFPAMLQAAEALKDDAVFLTISGDDDVHAPKKFILNAKSAAQVAPDNVLYGIDPMKSVIFDTFQTTAFPETYIIDKDMKMRRKLAGSQNWHDQALITYIRDLNKAPIAATGEVPKAP